MSSKNMSDIIEEYLKTFLAQQAELEIRRSDIAERFDCVPSQINYVINTRFTQEHGYLVESKRGGGGYIRILKVELVDEVDAIDQMIALIGKKISYQNGVNLVETLIQREIMTPREGSLILAMIDKNFLRTVSEDEQRARAVLMKQFLSQLRYIHDDESTN